MGREVDVPVAQVNAARGGTLGHLGALEPQRLLIEVGGGLQVLDHESDVANACGHAAVCQTTPRLQNAGFAYGRHGMIFLEEES